MLATAIALNPAGSAKSAPRGAAYDEAGNLVGIDIANAGPKVNSTGLR